MHRLVEMLPIKTFDPDGAYQITFINYAKEIETRFVDSKKEAIELYNLWMSGKDLPLEIIDERVSAVG